MIKLFACDLDGTLLNKDHQGDEIIYSTIRSVLENHKYFSISTGRAMHKSQKFGFDIDSFPIYTICMNGAITLDIDGSVLNENPISKDIVEDVLDSFPDICFEFVGKDQSYIRQSSSDHLKQFTENNIFAHVIDEDMIKQYYETVSFNCDKDKILSQNIYKIECRLGNEEKCTSLKKYLEDNKDKIVNAPFEDNSEFEITKAGVNKGAAVAFLANHLHIQEDEVAVYGDGGNDLEMLERFHHSYAMENGIPSAKEKAREIIGHCNDHAVSYHILQTIKNEA